MLEKFTHTNSRGVTLDFLALGIFANSNDLRDYEWSVTKSNDRITGLYKGIVKKQIPFVFLVNPNNPDEIKNKFYEHFDIDVYSQKKGYFTINGYKFYCYATKSVKTDYLKAKRYMKLTLEIQSDEPYWVKETTKTIDFSKVQESSDLLKYPLTYSFTYKSKDSASVLNEDFIESDAVIRVYGSCQNPLVKVNDNSYQVNTSLMSNEYLEIDTYSKTVYKYSNKGEATNIFDLRSKEYNVFSKIPSGNLEVMANGKFLVDIVVKEKRSEPRWS